MRFLIILYIFLWTLPHLAFSVNINYETCKGEKAWIDRVIDHANQFQPHHPAEGDIEAEDCSDCSEKRYKGAHPFSSEAEVENLRDIAQTMEIPPICFYASALRGSLSKKRHYSCPTRDTENPTKRGVRPCLSKEYIDMTAKAFNKVAGCFDFLPHEKQQMFALLNHESRFILNARSHTGARCYGQMTMPLIQDINKEIHYRNKDYFPFREIYTQAIDKCPGLKNKVVPPTILSEPEKRSTDVNEVIKALQRRAPITCNMTQDPWTCLFYSMFNMKMNMQSFDRNYNEVPDYMGTRELSAKMKDDFQLPFNLNEMLVVKGTVKKEGKEEEVEWVFWDTSEVYSVVNKVEEYDIKNLEVRKTKLFDEKTLRSAFLHSAHNGGGSIVRTHLKTFVEETKLTISRGSSCNKDEKCSKHRASMVEGKPLNIEDLQDLFSSYVDQNSKYFINPDELKEFTDKVERDMDYIHNTEGGGAEIPELKKEVKEKCPTNKDIYSYD